MMAKVIYKFHLAQTWYQKGLSIYTSVMMVQMSDVAILAAAAKYVAGDSVPIWFLVVCAIGFYLGRTGLLLAIGWWWERNNGWEIATKINSTRVEPGRVHITNTDELAEKMIEKLRAN